MSSPPFSHPPLCSALSVIKPPDCLRCLLLQRELNRGPWLRTQMILVSPVHLGSSFLCPQPDFHSPGSSKRELLGGVGLWMKELAGCVSAHTLDPVLKMFLLAIISILCSYILPLHKLSMSPDLDEQFSVSSPVAVGLSVKLLSCRGRFFVGKMLLSLSSRKPLWHSLHMVKEPAALASVVTLPSALCRSRQAKSCHPQASPLAPPLHALCVSRGSQS